MSYKRAVMCEELFELCGGDDLMAICLRQMLYWLPRCRTIDTYIKEEQARSNMGHGETQMTQTGGWVYKTAAQLKEEVLTSRSKDTVRKRLQALVEKGWLERRHNPNYEWDRTWQYRVNLAKVETDLNAIGYTLATVMAQDFKFVEILQSIPCDKETLLTTSPHSLPQVPIPYDKEALPETTPKITTEKEERVPRIFSSWEQALAKVCLIDLAVATETQVYQVIQSAEKLHSSGESPSILSQFHIWWNKYDWRGKTRSLPTPAQVREEWGRFVPWLYRHNSLVDKPLADQV